MEIRIGVEALTAPQRVRQALIHEIVTVVGHVYGAGSGEELTEEWVEVLGLGLYQVIRDNPDVMAFIMGAEAVYPPVLRTEQMKTFFKPKTKEPGMDAEVNGVLDDFELEMGK